MALQIEVVYAAVTFGYGIASSMSRIVPNDPARIQIHRIVLEVHGAVVEVVGRVLEIQLAVFKVIRTIGPVRGVGVNDDQRRSAT